MKAVRWYEDGLYEGATRVFPYTAKQIRERLDSDYDSMVQLIGALPVRFHVTVAVAVSTTYPDTSVYASYIPLLIGWAQHWATHNVAQGRMVL